MTHRRLALVIGALLLTGLGVQAHGFARRHDWARRARTASWRRYLGLPRLFVPAVLVASLPTLFALVAGWVFPHRLLLVVGEDAVDTVDAASYEFASAP